VHVKNSQLILFVNSSEVDILALSETNVGWHRLPIHQRLHERTRGWWEALHLSLGYYSSDPLARSAFQPGGTAVLSINQAAHRVHSSGSDLSGLGRWTWTRYSGKGHVALRVVSAYRPVYNPSGPLSAYNRQRAYLYGQDDDRCPRSAFSEDLVRELTTWIDAGDQLCLLVDVNDPIHNCDLTNRLRDLGLVEIFLTNHSRCPPPTYNRGQAAIDAIYVTPALLGSRCGYLAFGDAIPSDHRAIWVDIPYHIAFGHSSPPIIRPRARRLQCQDPRVVDRYLLQYRQFLAGHRLAERALLCNKRCRTQFSRNTPMNGSALIDYASRECSTLNDTVANSEWEPFHGHRPFNLIGCGSVVAVGV